MTNFLLFLFFAGFIFVLKSTELLEKGYEERARLFYCVGGTILIVSLFLFFKLVLLS
ncbi:MAG: hypothetical protein ACPLZH_00740 [Minisyncoccales bacterium]